MFVEYAILVYLVLAAVILTINKVRAMMGLDTLDAYLDRRMYRNNFIG